jgi:Bacterial Ig-like domain (group 2)
MGGDSTKRRFRPERKARNTAAYPNVQTGRRAFLRRLGLLSSAALAAPVLVRCSYGNGGTPPIPALGINVVPDNPTLINASKRVQALALIIGGGHHDMTDRAVWASSDPSVAAVQLDTSGRCRVDARAAGKVTITAAVSAPTPGFAASAELIVA